MAFFVELVFRSHLAVTMAVRVMADLDQVSADAMHLETGVGSHSYSRLLEESMVLTTCIRYFDNSDVDFAKPGPSSACSQRSCLTTAYSERC